MIKINIFKKIVFLFIFSLFVFSCAQKKTDIIQHKIVSVVEGLGMTEYQRLERLYSLNNHKEYLSKSDIFLKKYSNSSYAADVLYKRGLVFLANKNYTSASIEFNKVLGMFPNSNVVENAKYHYAISEFKKEKFDVSAVILSSIDYESQKLNSELKEKYLWLSANVFLKLEKNKEAIADFVNLYNLTEDESIKSKAAMSINSNIDKVSLEDLEKLKSQFSSNEWTGTLLFEIAGRYMNAGEVNRSVSAFKSFINDYPEHEYLTQAEASLLKLQSLDKVDPLTIGVILPLSGRYSPFGEKSLQGVQLAADFFTDSGKDKKITVPIKFAIVDSGDDADVSKLAMDKLIAEDNVIAVIGSLRSNTATVVAEQCAFAGIPNITLSQKEGLTDLGNNIFSIAMTNSNQIKSLLSYSMNQMNIKRYGILYPDDQYGVEFMKFFWDEALKRGAEVVAVESYQQGKKDFREEIQKLVGIYHASARRSEYIELRELKMAELGRDVRNDEVKLPSLVSFDALFIPDDARVVAQIAPYLAFYDVENVILLGTNTWNSSQLINRGGHHVEGAVFVDGFYANPPYKEGKQFISKFKNIFGNSPGVLEAQAFDATNIIVTIMDRLYKSGGIDALSREKLRKEISSLSSYVGATGLISFDGKGEAEKDLFILGVERSRIVLREK